jgi:Amidohydrolase family
LLRYLFILLVFISSTAAAQQQTIHFHNGKWFNGTEFVNDAFYSVNGLLTKTKPAVVDTVIDLQVQYIMPPFGEAHNHSPDTELDFDVFNERYLSDGIFYIKNPNSIPFTTTKIANHINKPGAVDVLFANGGLTATGGHPTGLYKYLLSTIYKKSILGWTNRSMEGHAFYVIDTEESFETKWPFILADKPGFIKLYLLYSEEYKQRKDDTLFNGKKGLNPKLLKHIISKAHAAGLTVSCHVETPADVLNAIKYGADELNHLPGYQVRWKDGYMPAYYRLTKSLVKKMKRSGVHVDPTYSLAETELLETDSIQYLMRREVQVYNLQLLKKYKVPVTIASDSYNLTARTEFEYLSKLHVYSNLELLKMWCETTPLAIFPNRKIASLKEGYEASFIVVKENPIENIQTLSHIQLRVKQGRLLW